ncbi:MAG: hypothetical protein N2486_10580 [Caloramator sp.]|nr:hypothetical protein [Caloramator sp.]
MDEKLLAQTRLLKRYLELLKDISKKEKDEYLKDEILRGAAERHLQNNISDKERFLQFAMNCVAKN